MTGYTYSVMVEEILNTVLVDKRQDVRVHLEASNEYMDAHGLFEYEEETGADHFNSRAIIVEKVKEILDDRT